MNNINLSELSFDNIGQWPAPVKLAMAIILSVVVVALGYWFIVKPDLKQYDTLVKTEKTLRGEFELKQSQAANLQKYRVQLQLMKEKFGTMLKRLPAKQEMPGLLEDISRTGLAEGLKFELFAPQKEETHDFYVELPIKIQVVGNYHQIAVFLSRITQMSRIVTLHDFVLTRQTTKNKNDISGDRLIMDMTAKIYRYRSL